MALPSSASIFGAAAVPGFPLPVAGGVPVAGAVPPPVLPNGIALPGYPLHMMSMPPVAGRTILPPKIKKVTTKAKGKAKAKGKTRATTKDKIAACQQTYLHLPRGDKKEILRRSSRSYNLLVTDSLTDLELSRIICHVWEKKVYDKVPVADRTGDANVDISLLLC